MDEGKFAGMEICFANSISSVTSENIEARKDNWYEIKYIGKFI